ncbi:MAG: hypothetical protein IT538_14505 [Variibacter sp.]|nr:hypothetical protein [Variibacter sp.]
MRTGIRAGLAAVAAVLAVLAAPAVQAQALLPNNSPPAGSASPPPGATLTAPGGDVPRPPAPIGNPAPPAAQPPAAPLQVSPPPAARPAPASTPNPAPAPSPAQAIGIPQMGGIALNARFGRDAPAITSGLHWRVYADKPDTGGQFRLLQEDRSASPFFKLPPGSYIVHLAAGLANTAKRIQVRADTVRETFELPVGGVRFDGRVGDNRIPNGQISFDLYQGSQFEAGEKRAVASSVGQGDIVLLPEGSYHVVSNYGDGNAVMRYDIRVAAGKLTDTRINHRAAVITLKLVSEKGGEALANTAWSVLTPGGDVIKESIGAFPRVVLSEGGYVALARNEGKVYNREFKVETGVDREIELIAR